MKTTEDKNDAQVGDLYDDPDRGPLQVFFRNADWLGLETSIENIETHYEIFPHQLAEADWPWHLWEKGSYNMESFLEAFYWARQHFGKGETDRDTTITVLDYEGFQPQHPNPEEGRIFQTWKMSDLEQMEKPTKTRKLTIDARSAQTFEDRHSLATVENQ